MCRSCHLGRSAVTKTRGAQWKKQLGSCEKTMLSAWARLHIWATVFKRSPNDRIVSKPKAIHAGIGTGADELFEVIEIARVPAMADDLERQPGGSVRHPL